MRRWLIVAFLVGIVGIAGVFAGYFFLDSGPDRLNDAITRLGFIPLTPPTTLRGPGAVYHVSQNGKDFAVLCTVEKGWLDGVLHESDSPSTTFDELTNAKFGVEGKLYSAISGTSDMSKLQHVTFRLEKTKIYEIALEDLAGIVDRLVKERPLCAQIINQYLQAGDYVCQIQQALQATAKYSIKTDAAASSSVDTQAVSDVIKAKIDPAANRVSETEVAGADLYYGVKLTPYCMSLPGHLPPQLRIKWYQRWFGLGG